MKSADHLLRLFLPPMFLGIAESSGSFSFPAPGSSPRRGVTRFFDLLRPRAASTSADPEAAWFIQTDGETARSPELEIRFGDRLPPPPARWPDGDVVSEPEPHRLARRRTPERPRERRSAISEEFLFRASAGPALIWWMAREPRVAARMEMLERAAETLGVVHGAEVYHGNPLLRHIAFDGSDITFLDTDEAAHAWAPLGLVQARDALRFLTSAAGALPTEELPAQLPALWTAYLRGGPPLRTVRIVHRTLTLLRPLARLAAVLPRGWLGRDAARAINVITHAL